MPTQLSSTLLILTLIATLLGCQVDKPSGTLPSSATLYHNGHLITMEGDSATYAEALVADSGKIVFVGRLADAEHRYAHANHKDLEGQTLLPGFIDAHGHAGGAGLQRMSANLLAPPDGPVTDIATLQQQVNDWVIQNQAFVKKIGWIIGFGYDDAQLKEQRHPTASELDQISTDLPVLLIHQSGHLFAVNHKALELSDITAATPNPGGGVIRREADGKTPNGVLEETAGMKVSYGLLSRFDNDDNDRMSLAGLEAYAEFGFTTAQEGRASKSSTTTWQRLADAGRLKMDVAVYPDIYMEQEFLEGKKASRTYTNHFRLAGIKMSLDGSPQGRTAWLTQPYKIPPEGQDKNYTGYPAYSSSRVVDRLVQRAYRNEWPILAHCNGDAAAEAFIFSIEKANQLFGKADRRPVMIHAQTVRYDQLDRMKAEGIIPAFFSLHTFYWGDWHRDVTLGKERAYRISPTGTALKKGMIFTEHHDAPVVLPSSTMVLHATVNRISRSGDIIGPDERVSTYHALKSITAWAAYQHFEEDTKGTLTPGKVADFVILDRDPLAIDPLELKDLRVMETIKGGVTIFKR
jgi:predicted amidohydrolase YtcJ